MYTYEYILYIGMYINVYILSIGVYDILYMVHIIYMVYIIYGAYILYRIHTYLVSLHNVDIHYTYKYIYSSIFEIDNTININDTTT